MALRLRGGKDIKKSSYYVWYLGARESKGVDAMPSAIDYLLERERLQEPFKVTLQISSKGLKIIQTVHPGGSTKSAVKHLVPCHAVLAGIQRDDIVAVTLFLPNPASNNPVHIHAYRCDSVETAELLGGQIRMLASQSDNIARISLLDNRTRSNLGSDGRSTRESESSEGSGELRNIPAQTTTIYESLAAELRAKLGRGNSTDNDAGPILLPPRDYDTVHRQRGNLAGIEFRRCLNQTIVGGNVAVDKCGTRSAASSGIGSDSAATPPPYHGHDLLFPRPSRPTRDSSSDDDWGPLTVEQSYIPNEDQSNLTLPRINSSSDNVPGIARAVSPAFHKNRRPPELRQRSPSPQYHFRISSNEISSPRERFQDAKEMFKAMEREVIARPVTIRQRDSEIRHMHRFDVSKQNHQDRISRHLSTTTTPTINHERLVKQSHPEFVNRENNILCKNKPRPKTHHYVTESYSDGRGEVTRPRPPNFYENPSVIRELRGSRNVIDLRKEKEFRDLTGGNSRELREKFRNKPVLYQELSEHERFPGLDRESARPPLEIVQTSGRYRHSYAEPPRLGLATHHPY